MSKPRSDESYTVEETQLDEFESGFITGVFAAWGVKEPTEEQYQEALELLIAHGREQGGA